ncbi:hypothetical protein [Desulforegula conservatrix]|uniref:hypothetical protein n=1 Tax=Desulforegula conservatrix TaxID=153026 RepID=UPI0003F4E4BA|nr:hypothetical protein [Desulforegula conservatrix]
MKIKGFTINMGSERVFTSSDASFEKRETFLISQGALPNSFSGDRVSISRESSAKIQSEKSFETSSKTVVKRTVSDASATAKPVIESITSALSGRKTSVTSLYSRSGDERTTQQQQRNRQPETQTDSIMKISRSYVHKEKESTSIASSGTIHTSDGTEISFNLFLKMQRGLMKEGYEQTIGDARLLTDPIVINLSGKPPEISDSVFTFDIDSDGTADKVHSLEQGNGFLALDRNMDGKINNGTELFGPSSGNGFGELSALDGNSDGWIDENDDSFSKLVIWTKDENGEDKLTDLKTAGLGAIFTGSRDSEFSMQGQDGNIQGILRKTGLYVKETGEVQNLFQIDLAKEAQQPASQTQSLSAARNQMPEMLLQAANDARTSMFQAIKEQIGKMNDNISKNSESNNKGSSAKDELFEKLQKRLDDLMKFFDEKIKESNSRNNRTKQSSTKKISTYI